jgi:hypothetical protein
MSSGCVSAIIRALNVIDPFVSRLSFVRLRRKQNTRTWSRSSRASLVHHFPLFPSNVVLVPEVDRQPYLKGPWFLFNDFVVHNISEDEALSFPSTWKVCVHLARLISYLFTRKARSPPCCISSEKTRALDSTFVVSPMSSILRY